jgi:hypothetical protein
MTEPGAACDTAIRELGVPSLAALEDVRALVDEVRQAWARSATTVPDCIEPPASGETP